MKQNCWIRATLWLRQKMPIEVLLTKLICSPLKLPFKRQYFFLIAHYLTVQRYSHFPMTHLSGLELGNDIWPYRVHRITKKCKIK